MFLFSLIPGLRIVPGLGTHGGNPGGCGNWGKAAILGAWGALAVSTIDHVVHPFLAGRDTQMHTLAVFLSLLGGLTVFGLLSQH